MRSLPPWSCDKISIKVDLKMVAYETFLVPPYTWSPILWWKKYAKEERQREQNALERHKNNAHKCYLSPILALLFEVWVRAVASLSKLWEGGGGTTVSRYKAEGKSNCLLFVNLGRWNWISAKPGTKNHELFFLFFRAEKQFPAFSLMFLNKLS